MRPKLSITDVADILGITVQAVHKRLQVSDINLEKDGRRYYFEHDDSRKILDLTFNKQIISFQTIEICS